jgi:hypothetical protein
VCYSIFFVVQTAEDLTREKGILWERVSELSTSGIVRIVDFGKRVPGFQTLSSSDQITLLKSACLEILVSVYAEQLVWTLLLLLSS